MCRTHASAADTFGTAALSKMTKTSQDESKASALSESPSDEAVHGRPWAQKEKKPCTHEMKEDVTESHQRPKLSGEKRFVETCTEARRGQVFCLASQTALRASTTVDASPDRSSCIPPFTALHSLNDQPSQTPVLLKRQPFRVAQPLHEAQRRRVSASEACRPGTGRCEKHKNLDGFEVGQWNQKRSLERRSEF